jgi:hypothetical protein
MIRILGAILLVTVASPASGQYPGGWGYPQYPAPAVHHRRAHVVEHRRTHVIKKTEHRSAASWKQSIIAQGKEYCRAHPSDSICPRH